MNWCFYLINRVSSSVESSTFEDTKLSSLFRILILLFFICARLICLSQSATPYSFTHYSSPDGLASNEITSITQDKTGYMWISSNNGLQRFDGAQFKSFRYNKNNPNGLPSNLVVQVLTDKEDNLWLVTAFGQVGIFDKNNFAYKPVPVKARVPEKLAWGEKSLLTDEFGNIFLLIRGVELICYDKVKKEFNAATNFIPFLSNWIGITTMSQQPGTHKYWLGLQGGGIAIYNQKTGHLSYYGNNVENEPAVDLFANKIHFAHSLIDKKGRVWFENWGPPGQFMNQYDPRRKANPLLTFEFYSELKSYHEVQGFLEQSDGRIWMKGLQLLAFFNEEEQKFEIIPSDYRNEMGIQYQQVYGLYEDREKNVWVTTQHNGLYRFNPSLQFFLNVPHKHPLHDIQGDGSVMSMIELRNGDVLTGAWGDGLYRYNRKLKNIPVGIKNLSAMPFPSIWNMRQSADSNIIWMACQPGLFMLDQAKNTMFYRNPSILQGRTVRQVVEDRRGNLWLGMHGQGLYRWFDPKNMRKDSIRQIEEVGKVMVNHLMIDSRGLLWVSTGAKGLFLFEGSDGKLLRNWSSKSKVEDSLLGDAISGTLEYNDSLVLVTTSTDIFFYNRNRDKIFKYELPEELAGAICSHQIDNAGYIWIGTTNALYRFHPFFRSVVMFNRFDGINNDYFVLASSFKRSDGMMFFGNDVSFISFNPELIKLSDRHDAIVITSLQVGKNQLPVDSVLRLDKLTIAPDENSLTVEFSPLTYSHEPVIQYRLDGIDDEWHTADRSRRASFPFLPPARYTLRLRTLNADGVPSPNQTVLPLFIRSPFYQTWWFYTLLGITAAFILYWFDRQRNKRKEVLQKVRTDIANGLHQEVNTALNNINILSEIARLKSDREPQKAKEYLEQIHSKSHNMIIALDDMLWSLDPENDAMDKTIIRIKEFADALMQRHNMTIDLLIDKKVEKLELNMKLRHEALLLWKEGLRSLVEAGTRLCIVHLTSEKGKLLFTIEFDNEGCDMQKLNNLLRRRDMEARLQALRAKLNVQVHKSRSVFLLQLPLG